MSENMLHFRHANRRKALTHQITAKYISHSAHHKTNTFLIARMCAQAFISICAPHNMLASKAKQLKRICAISPGPINYRKYLLCSVAHGTQTQSLVTGRRRRRRHRPLFNPTFLVGNIICNILAISIILAVCSLCNFTAHIYRI